MRDVTPVPATELRRGMRTYRRHPRNGRLVLDVTIGDPFTTSGSIQHTAYDTIGPDGKRSGTVVYSPCARVLVSTNNRKSRNKGR